MFRWISFGWMLLGLLACIGCGGGNFASAKAAPDMRGGAIDDVGGDAPTGLMADGLLERRQRLAQNAPGAPSPMGPPADAGPARPPVATDAAPPPATKPVDRPRKKVTPLLIYTATLHMAVFESGPSIDAVHQLGKDMGGYLVKRSDQMITIRVPSAQFYAALEGVGKLGDVLHRNESVRDVTDQFFDLRARLKNARATRDRLQALLAEAKNVKEVLLVEKELARVTEQIERMEGKLKLMRELIAFSTITVKFKPRPTEKVKSKVRLPFPWLNRLGLNPLLNL